MRKHDFELHHVRRPTCAHWIGGGGVEYAALCVREPEMMSFIEAQRGAETEQSE